MSQSTSNHSSSTSCVARPIAAKPVTPSRENVPGASYPITKTPIMANLGIGADSSAIGTAMPGPSMNPDSNGSRPFETKFSAATEMILKRIREGGSLNASAALGLGIEGGIPPPGYESVRRSVLQRMKTTLNMDFDAAIPPNNIKRGTKASPPKANTGISTPTSAGGSTPALISTAAASNPGFTPAAKAKVPSKAGKSRAGAKRKRGREYSDSSEESGDMSDFGEDSDSEGEKSATNLPTKTLSGRKIVRPAQFDPAAVEGPAKKRTPSRKTGRTEQALCKRCGRGHSPSNNMIVFCDGCNLGWHQMCHDPAVSDELVKEENKEWFCHNCSQKGAYTTSLEAEVSKNEGWAGRSIEEKYTYLSTFPQAHLISLLLHATLMYPDIPIYPPRTMSSSSIQQQLPPQPQPQPQPQLEQNQLHNQARSTDRRLYLYPQLSLPASTAGLFTRAEANPGAPINFIRKIQPDSASPGSPFTTSLCHSIYATVHKLNGSASGATATNGTGTPPLLQQSTPAPPPLLDTQPGQVNEDDESRESTPASPPYPRPGNGLMAKLPPDDQDLEWLVGDGEDEAAFSHVVIDEQNMRIVNEKEISNATNARRENSYTRG